MTHTYQIEILFSSCLYNIRTDPDYKGNVVSNASFSKIFGPGCRLGWMEAPERLRDILMSSGLRDSCGGFNHCMSGIMSSVISLGLLKEMLLLERPRYQVSGWVNNFLFDFVSNIYTLNLFVYLGAMQGCGRCPENSVAFSSVYRPKSESSVYVRLTLVAVLFMQLHHRAGWINTN